MRALLAAAATFFLLYVALLPAVHHLGAHGRSAWETWDSPAFDALQRQLMAQPSLGRWGGIYFRGGGLDSKTVLIHPDGRYASVHGSDIGIMGSSEGIVRPRGDRLFLGKKAFRLIPWGERMYLIADRELSAFADAIDRGDEPRFDHWGEFYLRRGDDLLAAPGVPALPLDRALRSPAPWRAWAATASFMSAGSTTTPRPRSSPTASSALRRRTRVAPPPSSPGRARATGAR